MDEVVAIVGRIAAAPFDPRPRAVPPALRGALLGGRPLGPREPSILVHLAQRALGDAQWTDDTTVEQYLDDLRQAASDARARLALYRARGGCVAGIFAPNQVPTARQGEGALPWLYVVYSADRGTIVSGYQVSSEQTIRLPGDERWLK
ncbi:MAG TPA: hypothetical protein VK066_12910 [Chloroflexota bacterium]|nr:hypothetical protein [Chloroflexota bacterium]